MLPRRFLFRYSVVLTTALVFGANVGLTVRAQTASQPGESAPPYRVGPGQGGSASSTASRTSAEEGQRPGYFDVVCPAGCYGGGFRLFGRHAFAGPGYYGFFRRYWSYGTYGPNYNFGSDSSRFGLPSGCQYEAVQRRHKRFEHGGANDPAVSRAAEGTGELPVDAEEKAPDAPAEGPGKRPAEKQAPPPSANTAHVSLVVPENAEVLFEGRKTTTTGTVRDYVSPPLEPGKNLIYAITVRYPDADGKMLEETHSIRIRANDQLRIDCTKPTPAAFREQ